jgi:hypothetical protein
LAEIVLDGLDQGHQRALIVAALRQFVSDNDLGACVDGEALAQPACVVK